MRQFRTVGIILTIAFFSIHLYGQKKGLESITKSDLKMHMDFLASDELEGRATGEPGLLIAARYLAVQAEALGLEKAPGFDSYFQYFTIAERAYDWDESKIKVTDSSGIEKESSQPFFVFPALQGSSYAVEGDVVFAGYGVKEEEHGYDDFAGIDIKDKIVLIMDRAPLNEEGTESIFGKQWSNMQNFQFKMQNIMMQQPKAILLVFDPKSGYNHIGDMNAGIVNYLSSSRSLKTEESSEVQERPGPKMVLIHREVADNLLSGTGYTLTELQQEIDSKLEPHSFEIEGKSCKINIAMKSSDLVVPNVFGMIEGSDPELKEEMVIYMAHYDHVGTDGEGGVFNGADDNASGSVALIEIAEAYKKEKKLPKRSVGFLWVAAEEIGLFGSSYFADHPMVPLSSIAAGINLDMVGRTITPEDIQKDREGMTIVGKDSVKVIGAKQSKVLMDINEETLSEMDLFGNYTYNDVNHPERFFYRSDHINFARKDIPVLFYSTGTHSDYHQLTDVPERIDYDKFFRMTRFVFKVGYNVADYKDEITVDNPMSGW